MIIRALFICSQNKLRSPTAEQMFAAWPGVETDSAGIGQGALVPLVPEQIAWASKIFVMESAHRRKLATKFKRYLDGKPVICLGIPDNYAYMKPELMAILLKKAGPFLSQRLGITR